MSKFYGLEAAPGKETKPIFGAPSEIFHLSVIAIPAGAQGHSTLYATIDGSTFAVATLDSARNIYQVSVDMILPASQKPVLTVKGNTKLHLTGYVDDMNDDGMPQDDEDFSDDGDSEEGSESGSDEEAELPVTKATKALEEKAAVAKKESPKKEEAKKAETESEDDLDDEELDEEELDEEDLDGMDLDEEDMDGLMMGEEDEEDMDFEEMDFDSEEDDESDDEEVAAPPATKARIESNGKSAAQGKAAPAGKAQQPPRQTGQKFGRK